MKPAPTLLIATLGKIAYFRMLPEDALRTLAVEARVADFEADQMIILEGEDSAGMWLIESGSVKIHRHSRQGAEHILHLLGPGDFFNDIPALDGRPNAASATALTLTRCWNLSTASVHALMQRYPVICQAAVNVLTARVRHLISQIEMLSLLSVPQRLARFLIEQAEHPSLGVPGITRAAIAAHLGASPETISRALRQLQERGMIRFDRHQVLIVDEMALRQLAMME